MPPLTPLLWAQRCPGLPRGCFSGQTTPRYSLLFLPGARGLFLGLSHVLIPPSASSGARCYRLPPCTTCCSPHTYTSLVPHHCVPPFSAKGNIAMWCLMGPTDQQMSHRHLTPHFGDLRRHGSRSHVHCSLLWGHSGRLCSHFDSSVPWRPHVAGVI